MTINKCFLHLKIELNHHDALYDASACAKIAMSCLKTHGSSSFDQSYANHDLVMENSVRQLHSMSKSMLKSNIQKVGRLVHTVDGKLFQ